MSTQQRIDECENVKEAVRRDQELSSGMVIGRTHEEVMRAARRALARRGS